MKRLFIIAAAALLAASCGSVSQYADRSDQPVLYFIDENQFSGNISNELIYRMLDMAYSGHSVTFGTENKGNNGTVGRPVVHRYSTPVREEAFRWALRMSRRGYTITVTYSQKTKRYYCTATTAPTANPPAKTSSADHTISVSAPSFLRPLSVLP